MLQHERWLLYTFPAREPASVVVAANVAGSGVTS